MKIVALIASYKRDAILRDCLAQIIPQVDAVVLVGSSVWAESKGTLQPTDGGSPIEKMIAKELDLIYVDYRNHPLGQKWQAGLNKCREIKADAVLICGSDDLLSSEWVSYVLEEKNAGGYISGAVEWAIYNPVTNELITVDYRSRPDPIGAGRIISKAALDYVDWQIFPTEGGIGCDLYSYRKLQQNGRVTNLNERVLLCVKGDWNMLDSWEQIISSKELDIVFREHPELWINKWFPDIHFTKYRSK